MPVLRILPLKCVLQHEHLPKRVIKIERIGDIHRCIVGSNFSYDHICLGYTFRSRVD